jgi:hypothetical protein
MSMKTNLDTDSDIDTDTDMDLSMEILYVYVHVCVNFAVLTVVQQLTSMNMGTNMDRHSKEH